MTITFIYRICFFICLYIVLYEGHCSFIGVCETKYNYHTARYHCDQMNGAMLTMDKVELYKEIIHERTFRKGKNEKREFWIHKAQGLEWSNISYNCNRATDKCRFIKMTNGTVLCKETDCDKKIQYLCEHSEIDGTKTSKNCSIITNGNSSRECQLAQCKENFESKSSSTSYNITGTEGSPLFHEKNPNITFVSIIGICVGLSVMLLLSTIPIVLKRRLARMKERHKDQYMMDEDGYHSIYIFGQSDLKSVSPIPRKSVTYSCSSSMKEKDAQTDSSNLYSKFSVQSSLYNKLKRSQKRSRKDNMSEHNIYNTLDVSQKISDNFDSLGDKQRVDVEIKDTNSNTIVDGVRTKSISISQTDEDCFSDTLSNKAGKFCPLEEVNRENEITLNDKMQDSSIGISTKVSSQQDYEIARCFHENDKESQSCEISNYEMARSFQINDNSTKSQSCRTFDYEMVKL